MYKCVCNDGWESESCSVYLEMDCNDEIDNDQGITLFIVLRCFLSSFIQKN